YWCAWLSPALHSSICASFCPHFRTSSTRRYRRWLRLWITHSGRSTSSWEDCYEREQTTDSGNACRGKDHCRRGRAAAFSTRPGQRGAIWQWVNSVREWERLKKRRGQEPSAGCAG